MVCPWMTTLARLLQRCWKRFDAHVSLHLSLILFMIDDMDICTILNVCVCTASHIFESTTNAVTDTIRIRWSWLLRFSKVTCSSQFWDSINVPNQMRLYDYILHLLLKLFIVYWWILWCNSSVGCNTRLEVKINKLIMKWNFHMVFVCAK